MRHQLETSETDKAKMHIGGRWNTLSLSLFSYLFLQLSPQLQPP